MEATASGRDAPAADQVLKFRVKHLTPQYLGGALKWGNLYITIFSRKYPANLSLLPHLSFLENSLKGLFYIFFRVLVGNQTRYPGKECRRFDL